jgi:mRNA-degrading endonuclease RelE of RelBE toxin-antitoxin system
MKYKIIIKKTAQKEIKDLPKSVIKRVVVKIQVLDRQEAKK